MRFLCSNFKPKPYILGIALLALAVQGVNGQTPPPAYQIVETHVGQDYTFSTLGLGDQDLVVYRFSDGFYTISRKTTVNPTAAITRRFVDGGMQQVVAYIARKGGPLRLTSTTFPVENACPTCPNVALGQTNSQPFRLSYTWMPFTNLSGLEVLTDNTTIPAFETPAEPWFFIVATVLPNTSESVTTIHIPAPFVAEGAIYKDKWGKNITIGPQQSIHIPDAGNTVTINSPASGNSYMVFILLKGTPQLGMSYTITGSMTFPLLPQVQFPAVQATVSARGNPHDPNILTARQKQVCPNVKNAEPLKYRVEFQNIGTAEAEEVEVTVNFDGQDNGTEIVDVSSIQTLAHGPAWATLNTTYELPNTVSFEFPAINLPGLYQAPTPKNVSNTIGWIEFQVNPKNCLQDGALTTSATVTFIAGAFSEDINTNDVSPIEYNELCKPSDECLEMNPGVDGRDRASEMNAGAPKVLPPRCYPSLFRDNLNIDISGNGTSHFTTVFICDVTGKKWMETALHVAPGETVRQELETAHLSPGMYFVYIVQGAHTFINKVIKNRI